MNNLGSSQLIQVLLPNNLFIMLLSFFNLKMMKGGIVTSKFCTLIYFCAICFCFITKQLFFFCFSEFFENLPDSEHSTL